MSRSPKSGFTLLELIIVLVVLAALAALVIPVLGWVRDQSKFATAAAGAAEIMNNIETYKAATGNYPNRFDSLVNTSGSVYSKVYGDGSTAVYGSITPSGTIGYYLSNGAGISSVMQHAESATNPNDSTDASVVQNPTAAGSASFYVLDPTTANSFYMAKLRRIVRTAFPNQSSGGANSVGIPAGTQLVVMGVGSRTSTGGTTMSSIPTAVTGAPGTYTRYLAVFSVSAGATGRGKVQLKMILDPEFEILAKNIDNFKGSGPEDSAVVNP